MFFYSAKLYMSACAPVIREGLVYVVQPGRFIANLVPLEGSEILNVFSNVLDQILIDHILSEMVNLLDRIILAVRKKVPNDSVHLKHTTATAEKITALKSDLVTGTQLPRSAIKIQSGYEEIERMRTSIISKMTKEKLIA